MIDGQNSVFKYLMELCIGEYAHDIVLSVHAVVHRSRGA